MKYRTAIGILFWLFVAYACQREEISFSSPTAALKFSKDTILCDTVYSQVRSETYALKVYNQENKDILIPKIYLEKNAESLYRINVDGKAGYSFENIPLRAKDSLFIFIEIAPNTAQKEFLAQDRIIFQKSPSQQSVTLLSLVQDAEFFVGTSAQPKIISSNTVWTNEKVKLIYGEVKVADGTSLTINKGTKVYFTKDSKMSFGKNASLFVNGDLDEEVVFRGDRNDPRYDTIPKNWDGLYFDEGAKISLNYAKIFGGTNGISMKNTTATLKNTILHTFQEFGIFAVNSSLSAENLVMNHCGQSLLGVFKGGSVDMKHCTLANYWNSGGSPALCVYASNEWTNPSGVKEQGPLQISFKNSIAYNRAANAFEWKPTSGQVFSYRIENSLLKYATNAGFVWDNNPNIFQSLQNQDPKFINYNISKMNLRVGSTSPAKGKGNITTAQSVNLDIKKINRSVSPTLGAYQ